MSETIETPAQMDALPDFTVLVSAPAKMESETVVIAVQKIAGNWYATGMPVPLEPANMGGDFFPATVAYRPTWLDAVAGGIG